MLNLRHIARLQGLILFMPVEGAGGDSFFGARIKRIPLLRGDKQITRKYCAFWKKDNSGYYVEEFAEILKSMF